MQKSDALRILIIEDNPDIAQNMGDFLEAPTSTHYNFHGCLKCHDDEVNPADVKRKPDSNDKNT